MRKLFSYMLYMAQDTNPKIQEDFNDSNIFDEFSQVQKVGDDLKKVQVIEERDIFYYFQKTGSFFLILNILLFVLIALTAIYIYLQTQGEKKEYSFLEPVCSLFLGSKNITPGTCYTLAPLVEEYKTLVGVEKNTQSQKILPLLGEAYTIENFNASKKVEFLLKKEQSRLRPLKILGVFDEMKFKFSPEDKTDISCTNIILEKNNILDIDCDIYSSDWDTAIITLQEGVVSSLDTGGTSISRASSFMNFLENTPDSPLTLLEKTSTLSAERVDIPPYTKKTTIHMKIKYSDPENLSF